MIPPKVYWVVVAIVLAVVFAPALLAGGGFIIAVALAVVVLVLALGGPYAKDLYETKHMGSKGRRFEDEWRDMLAGGSDSGPLDDNDRGGK